METRWHFLLATLKVLMCQTPFVITKNNTFEAKPTMCVSFVNKRKTQLGWVVVVGWKVRRWTSANNTPPKLFMFFLAQVSTRSTCWRSVCVSDCCISCITKVICVYLFVHHYLFQEHHLKSFVFLYVCVASLYYIDMSPKKQCNWLFWVLMMVDWTLFATITHMHWWWWRSDENIFIELMFQHFYVA